MIYWAHRPFLFDAPMSRKPSTVAHAALVRDDVVEWSRLVPAKAWREATNDVGMTWVHWAAWEGASECLGFLLQQDPALAQYTDNFGRTPLHLAAARGRINSARQLLSQGAAVDARDRGRATPLHWAMYESAQAGLVDVLLAAGANVNGFDGHSSTPLHLAIKAGNLSAMLTLLDHQADPEARDADGCSALLLAAREGQQACFVHLWQRGADSTSVDRRNRGLQDLVHLDLAGELRGLQEENAPVPTARRRLAQ